MIGSRILGFTVVYLLQAVVQMCGSWIEIGLIGEEVVPRKVILVPISSMSHFLCLIDNRSLLTILCICPLRKITLHDQHRNEVNRTRVLSGKIETQQCSEKKCRSTGKVCQRTRVSGMTSASSLCSWVIGTATAPPLA